MSVVDDDDDQHLSDDIKLLFIDKNKLHYH